MRCYLFTDRARSFDERVTSSEFIVKAGLPG